MQGIAGALALAAALWAGGAAVAEPASMTFRVETLGAPDCGTKCPEVIVATGVIDENTAQAFVEFAKTASLSRQVRNVVLIDSPGGNVVASMELGYAFRRLRSAAIVAGFAAQGERSGLVAGRCLSACVYALMGAIRRVVPEASRVGLHRMSIVESAPGQGGAVVNRSLADPHMVAVLARYAARMGVAPALVWRAESLSPGTLMILDSRQIAGWRLASRRL